MRPSAAEISTKYCCPCGVKLTGGRFKQRRVRQREDFSHQVYDALDGCLGCKSCAGQCPIKVNVPEFRSRFLQLYHRRYTRPLRDYLIASLEATIPVIARIPGLPALYNAAMRNRLVSGIFRRYLGMVDSPLLSRYALEP